MPKVYIGIGSNLGDRRKKIDKAVALLKNSGSVKVEKVSSIYETEPLGGPPQGKYLNGVIEASTALAPIDLLGCLLAIEKELGRIRTERNAPRTIDLDILLYDDVYIKNGELTVPHPRMHEREFVLRGLREIAPDLKIFKR